MTTTQPTPGHIAHAELDLARTYAAHLHMARTERQMVARIAIALECCAAARSAAMTEGLLHLVQDADALATAVRSAITTNAAAQAA